MPIKYSRSHERAENAKITRGLWESLFGLLLCWLPGVGLILSVAGFCRQAVRMTEAYKVRRAFSLILASVVLVAAIGVFVAEAYLYSRNPNIVGETGLWLWQKVTGQEALPGTDLGEVPSAEGDLQPEEGDVPDEYHTDEGQMEEGDVPTGDEQMEEGDVPVDDSQIEEGDVPVSEGDFQDNIEFNEDDSDETTGGAAADATLPPLSDLLKSHGVAVG
jgi:hypothetical protein